MITKDNLKDVIKMLPIRTKKRILTNTDKEYCVLYLYCSNAGAWSTARLTNDLKRYQHVYKDGNCIIDINVAKLILGGIYI